MERLDLLGAWVAGAIFILSSLVFISRLVEKPDLENWAGLALLLTALPLGYLLIRAPGYQRPALYYIQIGLMLAYLAVQLVVDYVLKIEFRQVRWAVIAYVMLFFGGAGGMIGVASAAGKGWMLASVVLFLVMAVLAFVQRAVTGM
jgi:hypothetical protein